MGTAELIALAPAGDGEAFVRLGDRCVVWLGAVVVWRAGGVRATRGPSGGWGPRAQKRARAPRRAGPPPQGRGRPPPQNSPVEQRLVDRLTRAWETSDVDGVVA